MARDAALRLCQDAGMKRLVSALVLVTTACAGEEDPQGDTEAESSSADVDDDDGNDDVMSASSSSTGEPVNDPIDAAALHNVVRANAQPVPDPPLPEMMWSDELAEIATNYAANCVWEHSMVDGLGENLYASTGQMELAPAVQAWADEDAMYDYETNTCSGVCGHYTQIVWRDSVNVGCGYADCPMITGLPWGGRLWVCNYTPPGNYVGERPY
jgi:pathogenesis-related protein 1